MVTPLFSTITLFTELLVTIGIGFVFYSGYFKNRFPRALAAVVLTYEVLFNISYMVYRTMTHAPSTPDTAFEIALAIFHGTLSLLMFITLLVFVFFAWRGYNKKINFLRKHRVLTVTFLFFWLLSVLSGFLFYFVEYYGFLN